MSQRRFGWPREAPPLSGLPLAVIMVSALLWAAFSPAEAANFREVRDGLSIEVSARPDPPREGERARYTVRLQEASGAPLVGATVRLTGGMPDGMTVRADLRPTGTDGVYSGRLLLTMWGAGTCG